MKDIDYSGDASWLFQEIAYLKERILDHSLLEVLIGDRDGSPQERSKLEELKRHLGEDRIYREAIYLLTHTNIDTSGQAKLLLEEFVRHREKISRSLDRKIGISVAALDYMQSVRHELRTPAILASDKYENFAYRAIIDATTHAYDRDLLDADLDAEIAKSRRLKLPFSILFLDIDNLKAINDTYGHETGTAVIKSMSECARRNLRRYDSIYRYGGDEFIIILPATPPDTASGIAHRIIALVAEETLHAMALKPGVSIGIASFDTDHQLSKENLLSAADQALYSAKRSGKNVVAIYSEKRAA